MAYIALWLMLYAAHISYLSFYRFDYGYNMAASVAAGILYTVIWLLWSLKVGRSCSRLFPIEMCPVITSALS